MISAASGSSRSARQARPVRELVDEVEDRHDHRDEHEQEIEVRGRARELEAEEREGVDARDAVRATGEVDAEPVEVERQLEEDLAEEERHDREVVAAQPPGREPEHEPEEPRREDHDRHRERASAGGAELVGREQCERVRAEAVERDEAEVEQARPADRDVQTDREEREQQAVHADADEEVRADDERHERRRGDEDPEPRERRAAPASGACPCPTTRRAPRCGTPRSRPSDPSRSTRLRPSPALDGRRGPVGRTIIITTSTAKTITFWNVDEMYAAVNDSARPDEHSAEHRAGDAPDAADHGARERLEPGDEAHQLEHAAEDEPRHHARDAREHAADEERDHDRPVDVDADHLRPLAIVGDRPHRAAELRAPDPEREDEHHGDRRDDHDDPDQRDVERADVDAARERDEARRVVVADVGPEQEQHRVLEEDRHAERRDQRRDPRGVAERPERDRARSRRSAPPTRARPRRT